jgi:hypothetical protein
MHKHVNFLAKKQDYSDLPNFRNGKLGWGGGYKK